MDLSRVLIAVRSKLRSNEISDYGPLQSISKCKPYFRHCLSHPEKIHWKRTYRHTDGYMDIATTRQTRPRGAELVKIASTPTIGLCWSRLKFWFSPQLQCPLALYHGSICINVFYKEDAYGKYLSFASQGSYIACSGANVSMEGNFRQIFSRG